VVEGILLLVSAGAFASAAGADNPLGIYVATALQFPASLLASPLYQAIVNDEHGSDWQAMIFSAITVAALEYGLLVLAFRRPWRR
jgi:hypothetical protein